jgi:hypothetical protein
MEVKQHHTIASSQVFRGKKAETRRHKDSENIQNFTSRRKKRRKLPMLIL